MGIIIFGPSQSGKTILWQFFRENVRHKQLDEEEKEKKSKKEESEEITDVQD